MPKTAKTDDSVRVKTTPPFKLKDKQGRNWQGINLLKQFGFLPETIIVEKLPGVTNGLIVRAVLTPEEIAKEDQVKPKGD